MKTIYRVNWSTISIEKATLLNEHNLCNGASVETWLCKDSNGQKFVCSKFNWQLSELAAWQEFEAEMDESIANNHAALLEFQKQHEEAVKIHLNAKQKIKKLDSAE